MPGHFPSHLAGIAVGHAGDEIDHAQERLVQRVMRVGGVVADQVEHTAALERRGAAAVLFQGGTTERVEQDFKRGVGADLVQCLAFILENLVARHVFGLQYAALGRAVHVLDQVAAQTPAQQCLLLLDESAGCGVGQVLDSLATQYCQFAPPGVGRAKLAIGFRQVVTDQVEQQRFDFGVVQQLHLQAVFQVDQGVADVIRCLHQVDQRVAGPALFLEQRQAELAGDLLQQRQPTTGN